MRDDMRDDTTANDVGFWDEGLRRVGENGAVGVAVANGKRKYFQVRFNDVTEENIAGLFTDLGAQMRHAFFRD